MNEIEQAKDLLQKIEDALLALHGGAGTYAEDEVQYRLNIIRGVLIIAHNDTKQMIAEWTADEAG